MVLRGFSDDTPLTILYDREPLSSPRVIHAQRRDPSIGEALVVYCTETLRRRQTSFRIGF